ncbi:hypothetical protein HanPI659440_Chr05g0209621 [Helianthus annuus]|nr:hypothetical protein HanPI659440_Chr05g0209621 [Helianthus annuus]
MTRVLIVAKLVDDPDELNPTRPSTRAAYNSKSAPIKLELGSSVEFAQIFLSFSKFHVVYSILGSNTPLNSEVLLRCKYHNPWIRIRYSARLI